jgi:hypothetical protein
LCIASMSSGVGALGWADVTMNMKRISELLLNEPSAPSPRNCLAN